MLCKDEKGTYYDHNRMIGDAARVGAVLIDHAVAMLAATVGCRVGGHLLIETIECQVRPLQWPSPRGARPQGVASSAGVHPTVVVGTNH